MQFLLLPIRDWNSKQQEIEENYQDCNFSYSLLGIETFLDKLSADSLSELQFLLLPIRDWNYGKPVNEELFGVIAISLTPY